MNLMQSSPRAFLAGILVIVGGAMLVVGSFLTWAELSSVDASLVAQGVEDSRGYTTLAVGIVSLLVGFVMIRSRSRSRMLAILAVAAGLLGAGVAVYEALTTKAAVLNAAAEELAPSLGATAAQVREVFEQLIDAGQLSVSVGIGLYVVMGGGIVALLGGFAGLKGPDSAPMTTARMSSSTPSQSVTTADIGDEPPAPSLAVSPPADRESD